MSEKLRQCPCCGQEYMDEVDEPQNSWHTGTPPVEEINEVNPYCYVLSIYYDGTWYLCDYLYKAVHEKGYFESAQGNSEKPEIRPFNDDTAWQKIKPF